MTGNRINAFDIAADQPLADQVMQLLGPVVEAEALHYPSSQPSDEPDDNLVARIARAENGPKYSRLFNGNVLLSNGKDGDGHLLPLSDALRYQSQSEADQALMEMLCFFSSDDEQVRRVFLGSALGRRDKAHRHDYVPRSIRSARRMIASNDIPSLDLSGMLARARMASQRAGGGSKSSRPKIGLILTRVSDVEAQEVRWIWPGRIAIGKVTVLAGHPGLGKSQLTADIASKVTTGAAWPNEDGFAPQGLVIMMSCEDDIADTIRPRLEAAGADLTKVEVVEGLYSAKGERRIFQVKSDMPHLEAALDRAEGVNLVIIDPITAYLNGEDSHNTGDVRSALAPLQDLAMQRGIAVIVVSHLNKSGGQERAVNAVTGSSAFVALARGAFLVEKDADDPERRLLLPIKNNLALTPGLAFRIRDKLLPSGIRAPFLEFEEGTVEITADEALSMTNGSARTGSAVDAARAFLIRHLQSGSVPASEMEERAKGEGIASKTLRKAREELGIKTRKATGKNGGWTWELFTEALKS